MLPLPYNAPIPPAAMRGLLALACLGDVDLADLQGLFGKAISLPAEADLGRRATTPSNLAIILSGWACEQRTLTGGGRQIFSILLPGDLVELSSDHYSVFALTAVRLAEAKPLPTERENGRLSRLSAAAQRKKADRLLRHVGRLGGLNAYGRLGHLLLELHDRLAALGLVEGAGFELPISQEVLGDTLGLTTVHVNRTLKQLRTDGFVKLNRGHIGLLKLTKLAEIADYEPMPEPRQAGYDSQWHGLESRSAAGRR
jgi:CRP-like cAMP-binding protein